MICLKLNEYDCVLIIRKKYRKGYLIVCLRQGVILTFFPGVKFLVPLLHCTSSTCISVRLAPRHRNGRVFASEAAAFWNFTPDSRMVVGKSRVQRRVANGCVRLRTRRTVTGNPVLFHLSFTWSRFRHGIRHVQWSRLTSVRRIFAPFTLVDFCFAAVQCRLISCPPIRFAVNVRTWTHMMFSLLWYSSRNMVQTFSVLFFF